MLQVSLTPGYYYRAVDHSIWQCVALSSDKQTIYRYECVRLVNKITQFFTSDGTHPSNPKYYLVEEVDSYGSRIK